MLLENLEIYKPIPQEDLQTISDFIDLYPSPLNNKGFKFIAEGTEGKVYQYKNYAIKIFFYPTENDKKILKALRNYDIFPTLFASYTNKCIVMEFIDGYTIQEYIKNDAFIELTEKMKDKCREELKETLINKVLPSDLHQQNLMIRKDGQIKIIDVGWFSFYKGFTEGNEYNFYEKEAIKDLDKLLRYIENNNKEKQNLLSKIS